MPPTNDAPVTVEQVDRECAASILDGISGYTMDAAHIRSGDMDRNHIVQDVARHRLAALASAPAGDGVVVPAIPTKEMLEASAVEWTGLCSGYPPEPGHYNFMTALWKAMLAAAPAALARPRAAVGEQSREAEIYLRARDFCSELCEDSPDVPQAQLKALHKALDAYEASLGSTDV